MSLHASKGLEFDVVFIAGCEEGGIPAEAAGNDPDALDEENRLLYVGMTRARRHLILTRSRSRVVFGKRRVRPPSRFLKRIAPGLLDHSAARLSRKSVSRQMDLFPGD